MVPFERALLSSYRPYTVTFPLSLRVSEILPFKLCASAPFFPTPLLVSPKFSHVPLEVGGWRLGSEERRCLAKANFRVGLVSKISNLCDPDPPVLQTDGQTDGHHAISIPRYALQCIVQRAVKKSPLYSNYETKIYFMRLFVSAPREYRGGVY